MGVVEITDLDNDPRNNQTRNWHKLSLLPHGRRVKVPGLYELVILKIYFMKREAIGS